MELIVLIGLSVLVAFLAGVCLASKVRTVEDKTLAELRKLWQAGAIQEQHVVSYVETHYGSVRAAAVSDALKAEATVETAPAVVAKDVAAELETVAKKV